MSADLGQRIDELETRVAALEASLRRGPEPPRGDKRVSVREFVISKSPKTSVDTALLIGYYLEKFEGTSPFSLDDLNRGFAQAKEPRPGNPSDMLYKNVRRGFLTEASVKKGGAKSYIVTNSGEGFVENGLQETQGELR